MNNLSHGRWSTRPVLLVVGLLACSSGRAGDGPAPASPWAWTGDAAGLRCLNLCQLDQLFRASTIHEWPRGFYPGEVLAFANMPVPDVVRDVANNHWKGKHFGTDGSFTNQWKHRTALTSCLKVGPSFLDGQPCFICEYPRLTPLFGPMRDEYREIAPGVLLGRQYRRTPIVKFLGYNVMQHSGCETGCAR